MLAKFTWLTALTMTLAMTLPGAARAGTGGTFAPGSTASIVIGVVAIAVIVLVIMRARSK